MLVGDHRGEIEPIVALHDHSRAFDRMALDDHRTRRPRACRAWSARRWECESCRCRAAGRPRRSPALPVLPQPMFSASAMDSTDDVERVRGRVLIEFLQMQQRQHHVLIGRASPPTASARRLRPRCNGMAPCDCISSCSHSSVSTSSPSDHVQRRRRRRSGRRPAAGPVRPDGAEADAERAHLPVLARLATTDCVTRA